MNIVLLSCRSSYLYFLLGTSLLFSFLLLLHLLVRDGKIKQDSRSSTTTSQFSLMSFFE